MSSIYTPLQFVQNDIAHLDEVMARYNFAMLVNVIDGKPFATHLPVLAHRRGSELTIDAHLARANPQWQALEQHPDALIIFAGPHTYVSPSEYRSQRRVPTWNYVTVHASGPVKALHSAEDKLCILADLIEYHDAAFMPRWKAFDDGMRDSLLGAIVGLRMTVTLLEGKFKLNQHRLADDRAELPEEYARADENRREIAGWMERLGLWTPVSAS